MSGLSGLNRIRRSYLPTILYRVSSFLEHIVARSRKAVDISPNTRRDSGFFEYAQISTAQSLEIKISLTVDCFVYSPPTYYHNHQFCHPRLRSEIQRFLWIRAFPPKADRRGNDKKIRIPARRLRNVRGKTEQRPEGPRTHRRAECPRTQGTITRAGSRRGSPDASSPRPCCGTGSGRRNRR